MKLLTWSDLPDGERYEVLDGRYTYGAQSAFYVRFLKNGVQVNRHPYTTEVAARKNFEKMVEEKAEN